MKNIIFAVAFFFFSFSLFSQTNIGFAKAGNLGEAISCGTQEEALSRFISALENKTLSPFFSARISQSWKNAEKKLKGEDITKEGMLQILKYVKAYPESMKDYGVSIYRLPAGNYTFETLTLKNGSWIQGKEISRTSRDGEWVLEWWHQKIASSWCLNLFGSVGEIQQPKETVYKVDEVDTPARYYQPSLVVAEQPCSCYKKFSRRYVKSNYGNRWYGTDNNYFDTGETSIGYFIFPAGQTPRSSPEARWEERPMYMCRRQG